MGGRQNLVLFPGSWGNRNEKYVRWWFRHVISHFVDWNIILISYRSHSLKDYVSDAEAKLRDVPDGAFAICYSAGAQTARGVATLRPNLFKKVVLISGLERCGIRILVLLHSLPIAFKPLWRVLRGHDLILDTPTQLDALMLNGTSEDGDSSFKRQLMGAMHGEPCKAVKQLALPPLRLWQKPFPCPVMAIVPENDFFVSAATYPGEDVQTVRTAGDHSLICTENFQRVRPTLDRIMTWLDQS
ncbi:MAG: alpha/beta hydrolase [Parcubacteria group bacterium]|nr:alpha/beta hydrolase [Parcubacteria group bacterium]